MPDRGDELWVELDAMAPHVVDALVASEDHRFWSHPGLDWRATGRAALASISAGRVVQGGSTLTQQTARLLAGRPRGTVGKVVEAWRAVDLELHLDKREILTWYLNRAYFGHGAYGIEAAARDVFGESAGSLSLAEAATLIGALPAPERDNPLTDEAAAREGGSGSLDRMVATGGWPRPRPIGPAAEPIQLRRVAPDGVAPHLVARVLDAAPRRRSRSAPPSTPGCSTRSRIRSASGWPPLRPLGVDHVAVVVVDVADVRGARVRRVERVRGPRRAGGRRPRAAEPRIGAEAVPVRAGVRGRASTGRRAVRRARGVHHPPRQLGAGELRPAVPRADAAARGAREQRERPRGAPAGRARSRRRSSRG